MEKKNIRVGVVIKCIHNHHKYYICLIKGWQSTIQTIKKHRIHTKTVK